MRRCSPTASATGSEVATIAARSRGGRAQLGFYTPTVPSASDQRASLRWLVVGAATWAGFLALSALVSVRLSLIDMILLLGPLVVVPLARPLVAEIWFPSEPVAYGAALVFALAFVNADIGLGGTALAVPWLAVAVSALARNAIRVLAARSWAPLDLAPLVACGFLVVGAFFAVATRAGWVVAGIHEPIVELTGVHFHFAGFATLVMATSAARALPDRRRLTNPLLLLAFAAPPAVAAGFTWKLAPFQIGGALMISVAAWSLAAITLAFVVPPAPAAARFLLVVSSLAIVAPMVLAVFWATAQYYDVAALSIPDMARIHGTINAFGFVTCGLAGWRLRSET